MKKLLLVLAACLPPVVMAAGGEAHLDSAHVNLTDQASLQRGARTFVNYCLSCHSAGYMRYDRMAADLGISESLLRENMMFASTRPGELMKAAMPAEDATVFFNVVPPDLSLTARSRGADWIYSYLRSFYRDDDTASGWNNTVFENVAMPHVLQGWQGIQRAVFREEGGRRHFEGFEVERPGTMSPEQYDRAMRDLTAFLVYLSEPARLERQRIGVFVVLFLLLLAALTWALKKEYWRDVH